ncbi:hypothetical protein QEG73_00145 [Chitinophagaceae bacterium 26-R-25]|nr:hypothetical protein [Chitinophagaceae bacterium 26-R-25]
MEKMVLLFLAMGLLGIYAVLLRLNNPSLSNVRLYSEMYFLPALLPAFAPEGLKKVSTGLIHLSIPTFIFHVRNTGKISFSPGLKPKALGGNHFLKQPICYALPFSQGNHERFMNARLNSIF